MRQRIKWVGLAMLMLPAISQADSPLINLKANIVENTCLVSIGNGGIVHLPTVGIGYFYDKLTPTTQASGTGFTINITGCEGDSSGARKLHFSFSPKSGALMAQNLQVFANETDIASGGAGNVGLVLFSSSDHRNVLNSDGTSDVVIEITNQKLVGAYDFYARYQHVGTPGAGKVTSNILVNTTYN